MYFNLLTIHLIYKKYIDLLHFHEKKTHYLVLNNSLQSNAHDIIYDISSSLNGFSGRSDCYGKNNVFSGIS